MPFVKSLDENATAMAVFKLSPEAFDVWPPLPAAVMRSNSELSDGEKELIGAYASGVRGCTHCFTAHYPVAVAYGIDESVFKDLIEDPEKANIDERLKPVLRFVKKLTLEPYKLVQKDADAIFEAGWSEATLTDIVMVCSVFSFMNTMMMGHGADQIDLSDFGPIHAVFRAHGRYGTGTTDWPAIIAECTAKFGVEKTMAAAKRAQETGMIDF